MVNMKLANIKKVDLRQAWKHEALDFTKWLAQGENLMLLSDEIGINLRLIQTEASVGRFNVDILAEDEQMGAKVIIENQLETTNHTHLGQIITYAAGYDAKIVIWIVKDVRDEHKQAIDWLNEYTDENINFFLIKMELWQIDDSPYAPKFYIVSQPNDWAKALKSTVHGNVSDTQQMQYEFWNKFVEYAKQKGTSLNLKKARPQHWYNVRLGVSDAHLSLTINSQTKQIACELYIPNNKELFFQLEKDRSEIEHAIDSALEWMPLENKLASRIKLSFDADINEIDNWEQYFKWLLSTAETFHSVFSNKILEIKN